MSSTLTPHAPYSVSKQLFELLNDDTANELLTIHNQEAATENELYQNKTGGFLQLYQNFGIDISGFVPTGKNSFASWLQYFDGSQTMLSVHNSFTNEEDLAYLKSRPGLAIYFCLCPNANLYIENTLPPIDLFRREKLTLTLGTDSLASNASLSILSEIKTIQQHFPSIPLEEILGWATINGAEFLGIDKDFGSLEAGKTPGIVFICHSDHQQLGDEAIALKIA